MRTRIRSLVALVTVGIINMSVAADEPKYYRSDGVRITHDPYAPGMTEKYGKRGSTDPDGFDPYRDSVGAGIYGGRVKRGTDGKIVIGRQYQNHNPRPGPVYAGTGYTAVSNAISTGPERVQSLIDKVHPEDVGLIVNEVMTGGAQPLHMCGMSRRGQESTALLISLGADIEALDTYGMTPLHRMASNNLAIGALALLEAGADPHNTGKIQATPMQIARESEANEVLAVLSKFS